jgi:hypothetical protein
MSTNRKNEIGTPTANTSQASAVDRTLRRIVLSVDTVIVSIFISILAP